MYSFGNKRNHGEKAKQQATVERVAPSQTLIFSEQQLDDLAAEIFNQIMRSRGHKQRWKSSDLKPSKEAKLLALDQFGRWSRAPPKAKENIQLVPEQSSNKACKTGILPSKSHSQTMEEEPEKQPEIEPVLTTPCQGELSASKLKQKVAALHTSFISKELDLRSNPCKGGEDGVILISLNSRDVEDSIHQIQPGRKGDIRPVNQAYQPNQEDLSHKSTCSRNSTQQGVTQKKNRFKSVPHEEDIQRSIRHTSSEPEGDQRLLIEAFRSNQAEPSYKITWFGNLPIIEAR